MVTKLPRITFTPTPDCYAALMRLSAANKSPPSAIVREMMDVVLPHMEMMVELLERASKLTNGVREAADAAARDAGAAIIPLLEEAERAWTKLEQCIDEPGFDLGIARPPSSNTGATCSEADQQKAR